MNVASVYEWIYWVSGAALGLTGFSLGAWALFWDRPRGRKRCPKCWYDMSAAIARNERERFVCPECGRESAQDRDLQRTRRRWRWAVAGAVLATGAICIPAQHLLRKRDVWRYVPTYGLVYMMPWFIETSPDFHAEFERRILAKVERTGWESMPVPRRVASFSPAIRRLVGERSLRALNSPTLPEKSADLLFDVCADLTGSLDRDELDALAIAVLQDVSRTGHRAPMRALRQADTGAPEALEAVFAVIESMPFDSPDPWVLADAAGYLGEHGAEDVRTVPVLINLWAAPESGQLLEVREMVLRSLAILGPRASAALPLIDPGELDDFWNGLQPLMYFAYHAIKADRGTRTQLLASMLKLPQWPARDFAAEELGRGAPEPETVAALVGALSDGMNWVRIDAADSLLKLGAEREQAIALLDRELVSGNFDAVWRVCHIALKYRLPVEHMKPVVEGYYRPPSRVPQGNVDNLRRRLERGSRD